MPGVHQRLVANHREVMSLRTFVATGFSNLGTQMSEAFLSQELAIKERDHLTGEAYMVLAQKLLGHDSSPPVRAATNRPSPSFGESRLEDDDDDDDATTNRVMARPHSLVMKHKSLFTIYYEWYGLETYANTPVEGGIASLESRFKTKWRAHFSPAEKQYFSRLQKVVRGIDERCRREDKQPNDVLDDWNALYQAEGKSSVTKMSKMIQEMGFVATKMARGKNRPNQPT